MIRLYGPGIGEYSFVQVARGMARAAEHAGVLERWVKNDEPGGFEDDGAQQIPETALVVGQPAGLAEPNRAGHKNIWLLLAPNGEHLPGGFVEAVEPLVTGLLAPSPWAQEVLMRHFPSLPVKLAPHGITPEVHRMHRALRLRSLDTWRERGEFMVLHFTSAMNDRKGTMQVVAAWNLLWEEAELPENARLFVVADVQHQAYWKQRLAGRGFRAPIEWRPAWSMTQHTAAAVLGVAHAVCQPSRAEGFGLVPLEAMALGVPIVATDCTGHGAYISRGRPGVRVVPSHGLAALDDFDGSVAPEVRSSDVAEALAGLADDYERAHKDAMDHADGVREEWAWETVNEKTLKAI